MDFKEALGAIIAGIVLMVPAVKWLIHSWAEKSAELEKLKENVAARALSRLEDDVKSFRTSIDKIENALREHTYALTSSKLDIASLKVDLVSTKKMIEEYNSKSGEQVKNMIKTEITELTKQLMLIRTKKNI